MALYWIQIRNLMRMLTCLVLFMLSTAHAATQTYGPSYPEVWGYDLSEVPAVKWGAAGINAYAMDDGDIWFVIPHSYKEKNSMTARSTLTDEKYLLIKFFKGEQLVLSAKEREALFEITENKDVSSAFMSDASLTFRDGSKLRLYHGSTPRLCYVPEFFRNYFIKTDPQGYEKKYSILLATPQVQMQSDQALCDAQGAPFLYQKLYMLSNVLPLKDDTFLLFEEGGNIIVRLDKDLKTKFKPVTPIRIQNNRYLSRNFFVIDYSIIENLNKKLNSLPVPLYQSIHDALLLHFHNQYKY